MLAVNPADRPQSARELLAALRHCRESVAKAPRRRRMLELTAMALALLIVSAVGLTIYFSHQPHAATAIVAVPEKSMAVLPFKPLLPENRDQVLETGMADTLITKLGNSGGMIVPSLASVRKYGSLDQDPLAAGRKLGVSSVLEGTVQKSGDRIRVTARLIKVADGSSLWVGTFDEKFTDVFAVEDRADCLFLELPQGGPTQRVDDVMLKRWVESIRGARHRSSSTSSESFPGSSAAKGVRGSSSTSKPRVPMLVNRSSTSCVLFVSCVINSFPSSSITSVLAFTGINRFLTCSIAKWSAFSVSSGGEKQPLLAGVADATEKKLQPRTSYRSALRSSARIRSRSAPDYGLPGLLSARTRTLSRL
jgi:TolB-like protein